MKEGNAYAYLYIDQLEEDPRSRGNRHCWHTSCVVCGNEATGQGGVYTFSIGGDDEGPDDTGDAR